MSRSFIRLVVLGFVFVFVVTWVAAGGGIKGRFYYRCADAPGPIQRGQEGYSTTLDADGDGVACEWSGR